jgi:hypothetical protein
MRHLKEMPKRLSVDFMFLLKNQASNSNSSGLSSENQQEELKDSHSSERESQEERIAALKRMHGNQKKVVYDPHEVIMEENS